MRKGFTLLELIIVIIILGILVAIGIVNYTASIEKARGDVYINNMRTILGAWRIYNLREATDYAPPTSEPHDVEWINNTFGTTITESYFGNSTTPGGFFTGNTTDTDVDSRYLELRGNRISNIASYIQCMYYYQRSANMWNWEGTWPWVPEDE